MGEQTGIAWTDHTFNPWRGCARVSEGCRHCYAEAWAKRNPAQFGTWGVDGVRVIASDAYWREPEKWNRKAEKSGGRRRVFCASLADWLEDRRDLDVPRGFLCDLIHRTPSLEWLLLTKRPENFQRLAPFSWQGGCPDNVRIGVTAEDQPNADRRIAELVSINADNFVSVEPMIGPVTISPQYLVHLDWIIVGGESGAGARPMDYQWAFHLKDECADAGVPFFYKQGGAAHRCEHDSKGGCLACQPLALRVRQFPGQPT